MIPRLLLASFLGAVLLESLAAPRGVQELRTAAVVLAVVLSLASTVAGIGLVVFLVACEGIFTTELLDQPGVSLARHALVPLIWVAAVRRFRDPMPAALVPAAVILAAWCGFAAWSSGSVYAEVDAGSWIGRTGEARIAASFFVDPVRSYSRLLWSAEALMTTLCAAGLFLSLYDLRGSSVSQAVRTSLAAGLIVALAVGLVQWWMPFNLDKDYHRVVQPNIFRVDSTWTDPNSFGFFLVVAGPISVVTVLQSLRGRAARLLAGLLTAALAVVLWMTASRTALAALGMAAATLLSFWSLSSPHLALGLRRRRLRLQRLIVAAGVGLIVLAGVSVSCSGVADDVSYGRAHGRSDMLLLSLDFQRGIDGIVTDRTRYWRSALSMWHDAPLTGVGIGQYALLKNDYRGESDSMVTWHGAHNAYLEVLAELGVLGLASLVGFIIAVVREASRSLTVADGEKRMRLLALLIGLMTAAYSGLAGTAIIRPGGMIVLMAMAALVFVEKSIPDSS